MSSTSSEASTVLCTSCKAINFDEILSNDYLLGIPINDERTVCSLRHVEDISNSSCSLRDFFRNLKPANHSSSDHLFFRAKWAKGQIRFEEDLRKIELASQTSLRIVPHDTVVLDIYPMTYIQGKYRPVGFYREENQFMELGSEEDSNQIAARKVDDRVNFKLIRSWLMFCQEHHQSHCHAGVDGIQDIPGFTVIDCASRGIVPWAEIPAESNRDYTALSYLWGTDTSTATQDGMIPSPSPKVIEDAVTATLGLGFKYLWVDRYCIPQHDPELKSAQIKRMDDMYGLSAVTIVAAAGDNPAYGLPGVSSTPRLPQKSVRIGSRTLIAIKNDTSYDIRDSKWNTRAWTLQEGVLSTRRFCFEDSQVYFQCNLMHRLESISIPDGSPKIANPATDINSTYLHGGGGDTIFPIGGISEERDVVRIFEEYITRQISYPSDGLHAFEGVLRKATVMKKPLYNVWGVLVRTFDNVDLTASLVVGLCWTLGLEALQVTVIDKAWETPYPGSLRRRLFPSWSWVDWVRNFTEKCIHIQQPLEIWMFSFASVGVLSLTQSIAMEYPDGIRMSWPDSHHDILFPSPPKEAPRILRIRGYTCDAVLWKLPQAGSPDPKGIPSSTINSSPLKQLSDFWFEDGWVWSDRDRSHCHLLLTWPTGIAFNFYDLSNEHLCLCVDWLETDKGPSSPTPLQDEYSFRIILLGRREDRLDFVVLTPVDHESKGNPDAYERVNIISRPLPLEVPPKTPLEELDPKFLRGWTMEETIVV